MARVLGLAEQVQDHADEASQHRDAGRHPQQRGQIGGYHRHICKQVMLTCELWWVDNCGRRSVTLRAENPLRRLRVGDRVIAVRTLADGVVLHLHAQRVRIAVRARLVVEALFAQFLRCKWTAPG